MTQELHGAYDPDPLWRSKFSGKIERPAEYATIDGRRQVVSKPWTEYLIMPGFSTAKFVDDRHAGLAKTSTANAHTVS